MGSDAVRTKSPAVQAFGNELRKSIQDDRRIDPGEANSIIGAGKKVLQAEYIEAVQDEFRQVLSTEGLIDIDPRSGGYDTDTIFERLSNGGGQMRNVYNAVMNEELRLPTDSELELSKQALKAAATELKDENSALAFHAFVDAVTSAFQPSEEKVSGLSLNEHDSIAKLADTALRDGVKGYELSMAFSRLAGTMHISTHRIGTRSADNSPNFYNDTLPALAAKYAQAT